MLQTGIISLIIAQIVFQFKTFSYSSSYLPMGANESEASRNQLTFALQNEVDSTTYFKILRLNTSTDRLHPTGIV